MKFMDFCGIKADFLIVKSHNEVSIWPLRGLFGKAKAFKITTETKRNWAKKRFKRTENTDCFS